MNRKRFWVLLMLMNIMIMLIGAYFFFGGQDFSAGKIEGSIKIGACYMTMNSTYFDGLNSEISSYIEERGDILLTRDAAMSQEYQNQQIEDLIKLGVQGIFVAPVNWISIEPALIKAKEMGIIIIIIDTPVYNDELVNCTVTTDNYDAGLQLAKYLISQVDSAEIVLVQQAGVKSCIDRIQGFTDTISNYPDYKIVQSIEGDGRSETVMVAMEEIIKTGITFDTVFAINDASALGALSAIDEKTVGGKINILSVNGSPEGKYMIKEERIISTAAQFPAEMGNKAAVAMYDLMTGVYCEKEILIPVKLITKNTIGGYDTDKWQ